MLTSCEEDLTSIAGLQWKNGGLEKLRWEELRCEFHEHVLILHTYLGTREHEREHRCADERRQKRSSPRRARTVETM
jgi:hypothetical protein